MTDKRSIAEPSAKTAISPEAAASTGSASVKVHHAAEAAAKPTKPAPAESAAKTAPKAEPAAKPKAAKTTAKSEAADKPKAAAKGAGTSAKSAKADPKRPSEEEIHKMIEYAAYFRAEHRNFEPGHEQEDWDAAEAQVRAIFQKSKS